MMQSEQSWRRKKNLIWPIFCISRYDGLQDVPNKQHYPADRKYVALFPHDDPDPAGTEQKRAAMRRLIIERMEQERVEADPQQRTVSIDSGKVRDLSRIKHRTVVPQDDESEGDSDAGAADDFLIPSTSEGQQSTNASAAPSEKQRTKQQRSDSDDNEAEQSAKRRKRKTKK